MDIDAAYDVCEQITRVRARDRYSAVERLPAYRRRGLCATYVFARRVDDTGHGNLRRPEKLRLLADARVGIRRDGTQRPTDPVLAALENAQIAATALRAQAGQCTPPDRFTATVRLVLDQHELA